MKSMMQSWARMKIQVSAELWEYKKELFYGKDQVIQPVF